MKETFIYDCNLNIENFVHMLDDSTECYKFYWLDSIMQLISQDKTDITFDDVISGMIADAWYSVTEYHLRMGTKDAMGNSVNSIERAVNKLAALNIMENIADRDTIIKVVRENDKLLHNEKYQLTKHVPYRVLSSFMKEVDGNNSLWDQRTRLIEYLKILNVSNCLPYTIGDEKGLNKSIIVDDRWRKFFLDNMVSIRGWIKVKKIKYLQDRNPGIPGIIYKLGPENEKQRKLQNVRKLWASVIEVSQIKDIYSGHLLMKKGYEIDHFVPWSYVANDELWNLIPAEASLNSSKKDRLPEWNQYFMGFARNQFVLNESIYRYPGIQKAFINCQRDNLNATWPFEELYLDGILEDHFIKVLEQRLKPIYEAAHTQGYGIWQVS